MINNRGRIQSFVRNNLCITDMSVVVVVVGILLSRETMVAPCLVKSVWLRAASGMAQQTYPGVTVLATSEANEIGWLV